MQSRATSLVALLHADGGSLAERLRGVSWRTNRFELRRILRLRLAELAALLHQRAPGIRLM